MVLSVVGHELALPCKAKLDCWEFEVGGRLPILLGGIRARKLDIHSPLPHQPAHAPYPC